MLKDHLVSDFSLLERYLRLELVDRDGSILHLRRAVCKYVTLSWIRSELNRLFIHDELMVSLALHLPAKVYEFMALALRSGSRAFLVAKDDCLDLLHSRAVGLRGGARVLTLLILSVLVEDDGARRCYFAGLGVVRGVVRASCYVQCFVKRW